MPYFLYAVELRPEVWEESPKFRKHNKHLKNRKPLKCYYIGTSSDPVKRLQEHLNGIRSNSFVRKYFKDIDYSVTESATWNESVNTENDIVQRLRQEGAAVVSST